MNSELTEEEMRRALFGPSTAPALPPESKPPVQAPVEKAALATPKPASKLTSKAANRKTYTPRLRVTLHVQKEYEGPIDVFTYDADTLSTVVAEMEAKADAKKKKYKYFEVISTKSLQ